MSAKLQKLLAVTLVVAVSLAASAQGDLDHFPYGAAPIPVGVHWRNVKLMSA